MLKLLLDEQISPEVAEGFRRQYHQPAILPLREWELGRFLGQPGDLLLQAAAHQQLTLVTYDRRTIPPLLKRWAEAGQNHGGVIFVDEKTIPASDFGGLIRALHQLASESVRWDWTSRICFLRR
jgi:hypothetical protein